MAKNRLEVFVEWYNNGMPSGAKYRIKDNVEISIAESIGSFSFSSRLEKLWKK